MGGLTFLVLLLMAASIFYISTHVQVVGIGYEINNALTKKQNLIEENKRLSLEIARLRSPTRIEKEAGEKLNLGIPEPHQWIPLAQLPNSTIFIAKPHSEAPKPKPEKKTKPPQDKKIVQQKTSRDKPFKDTKPKKVILAKIVRPPSTPEAINPKISKPKKISKSKEGIPAVLIDPLP